MIPLELFKLVIAVFACYRMAILVSEDDLPFGIMARLRNFASKKADYSSIAIKKNVVVEVRYGFWWTIAELFTCCICSGFWFSLTVGLVMYGFPAGLWYGFAISGAVTYLLKVSNRE